MSAQDALVFDLVHTKMKHSCNQYCRDHGPCKKGFPFAVHDSPTPTQDPVTRQWLYHRAHTVDQYTVPYHPTLLALWRAHCNVLRISNEAWSTYILKYVMKAECSGDIDADTMLQHLLYPPLPPAVRSTIGAFCSLTQMCTRCALCSILSS